MRNRCFIGVVFVFVFIGFLSNSTFGQKPLITCNVKNQNLNQVLADLTTTYKIRFAFDNDRFSKIPVSLSVSQMPLDVFLELLAKQYGVGMRLVGGSYVMFFDAKLKQTEIIKVTSKPVVKPKITESKPQVNQSTTNAASLNKTVWLEGYVNDAFSHHQLKFCSIRLVAGMVLVTNELGYFKVEVPVHKTIRLQINQIGYEIFDSTLVVNESFHLHIDLIPSSLLLESVTITKELKSTVEYTENPELIAFNPQTTFFMPKLDGTDMVNALSLVPGISFIGGSQSGLSVRGSAPTENMVLLDGIPILETSHLYGNLSVLNAKYIHQAFVSRGGFGAEYGGRVSGIVDLTGKTGGGKRPQADVTLNLIHLNGYFGVPLNDKLSVSLAFRKSFLNQFNSYLAEKLLTGTLSFQPDQDFNSEVLRPKVSFQDMNAKISFKPKKGEEYFVSFLNGLDDQSRSYFFDAGSRMYRSELHQGKNSGLAFGWNNQHSKFWTHRLSAGYNDLNNNWQLNSGQLPNKNGKGGKSNYELDQNELSERRINWQSDYSLKQWKHQFGFGITQDDLYYKFKHYESNGNNAVDSLFYDRQIAIVHAFTQHRYSFLNDQIKLKVGVRAHANSVTHKLSLQPRFSMEISPYKFWDFYYLGGNYLQYLTRINRVDAEGMVTPVWFIPGSDRMGELNSWHHIVGAKYEKEAITFNIEAYNKQTAGKVSVLGETYKVGKERFVQYHLVGGNEIDRGLDLYFQYRQRYFNHMIAYSLGSSTEQSNGVNQGNYYPSLNDQRHRLRLTELANYKGWIGTVNWCFATGAPFRISNENSETLDFGRMKFFSQFDVSVTKQYVTNYLKFEGGISLLNILNRKNVLGVDYFRLTGSSTDLSVKSELTALSFTPVVFLTVRFD